MYAQIRPLTGIRGIAALWVVMHHETILNNEGLHGVLGTVARNGYLGVDIFFILSGFIMSLSYKELFSAETSFRTYAVFLIRRMARIYPLYAATTVFVALLLISGISRAIPTDGLGFNLLLELSLTQQWGLSGSLLNPPSWSLSTEFAAYLVFPLLLAVLIRGRSLVAYLTAAVCIGTIVYLSEIPGGRVGPLAFSGGHSILPLARCISEFCLGMMAYRLSCDPIVGKVASWPLLGLVVVVALALLIATPGTDALVVLSFPALILVLAHGTWSVPAFFGSTVVFFLGEISYSVYLLQWQLVRIKWMTDIRLTPHIGPLAASICSMIVFVGVLIFASWAVYTWLEKPCRRWLRRTERLIDGGVRSDGRNSGSVIV